MFGRDSRSIQPRRQKPLVGCDTYSKYISSRSLGGNVGTLVMSLRYKDIGIWQWQEAVVMNVG